MSGNICCWHQACSFLLGRQPQALCWIDLIISELYDFAIENGIFCVVCPQAHWTEHISEYQNIQKQLARMIHIKSIVHLYPCQCKIWFVTLITHFIYFTGLGGEVFEQLQLPSNLGIILLVLLWMLVLCKICFGFPQKLLSSRESQVSINVAGSD